MISPASAARAERICPQCGFQYPARAKFCPRDGTRLERTGDISQSAASSVTDITEDDEAQDGQWEPDSLIGHTVATHYKLTEKIGQGGMGVVFKATHVRISRPAAIKILNPELAGDPEVVARFGREAEMASRLNHPNAVGIYDVGEEENGLVYIAMEYVDGEQLSKIIEREGHLPPLRTANIIRQVAGALDAAHQLNIVHRDLKPDNIMICRQAGKVDWVKVVDFGIAKQTRHGFGYQSVTRRGLILGTPEYMAPEQLLREPLDSRTDIYSLGLVAYKMLTGKQPFTGKNSQTKMVKKLTEPPRGFKDARPDLNLSPEIEAIVMKAISRERGDRYSTTLEFSAALERAAGGNPLYDPSAQPLLQSVSTAAGVALPLPKPEETGAQTSDSEHQSTVITFPPKWSDSPSSSQMVPPTVEAFPAVKETRPVEHSASESARAPWPDHSPEDDISSWQSAPAHPVAQTTYAPAPVGSKKSSWIFFLIAVLIVIIGIIAAVIFWRMNQPQDTPVPENQQLASDTTKPTTAQPPPDVQLPTQPEAHESITVSAPPERTGRKPSRDAARSEPQQQPAEDSTTRNAAPTAEVPPPKEEADEKPDEAQPEQPETRTEEKPPEMVRRSRGVVPGTVVRRVEPSYPSDALRHGINGKVVVEVAIDENGRVISATVLSGPQPLRDAAVRAARRWRFKPTLLNGVPAKASRTIEFNFVKGR